MSLEVSHLQSPRTVISNSVFNHVIVISKPGVNVSSVPMSAGVPLIRVIEDGGGYKQNRLYILRSDNQGYDPTFPQHTHNPLDTVNEGGAFYEVRKLNAGHLLDFNNQSMVKEGFIAESDEVSTTVLVNERLNGSIYVKGTSNQITAVNKSVNLYRGGLRLDFSYACVLFCKFVLSHNGNILFRGGVNPSPVSNVAGSQNQVAIEGCSSAGTNIGVRTGNGTSSTYSPLVGSNMQQANPVGYKLEYLPGNKVVLTDGFGGAVIKTDNLPSSNSASDGDKTLYYGMVTASTVVKTMKLYASHLLGKIYDTLNTINAWVL